MTFLDWCLSAPEDETLMDVKVVNVNGKVTEHFGALKPVRYCDLERIKPLKLLSADLKDDIWYVVLSK